MENAEVQLITKRCILDSLLSQPTNTKPADLMRNTYNESPHIQQSKPVRTFGQSLLLPSISIKSILMEHCYARPYNWRPDAKFLRPTKTLFIKIGMQLKGDKTEDDPDEPIDICNWSIDSQFDYDVNAKNLMDECERHVIGVRDGSDWEHWADNVPKIHWSNIQHNLFNSIVELLDNDRMARLAYAGHKNEVTLRRTVIDKSISRFRILMAKYIWDVKLVQWLHGLLMEHMSGPYLAVYLDILQSLRQKLPTFVEKLMNNPDMQPSLYPALHPDKLEKLLHRAWDPLENAPSIDKSKPLPGNPVIMIIPSATVLAFNKTSKRVARWASLFSNYGTVVTVQNTSACNINMTINDCVDYLMFTVHAKFEEIKAEHPGKQIVLVACNSSCAFALQLAQAENVVCVINLGFSIFTPAGSRGGTEDNLLDLLTPVLFVIGQVANTSLQENMQDIRERMRVETGLLIVGGADDYLRVNKKVKRAEGITQSMADRCIVEEAIDFISGILLSPYPPKVRQNTTPSHLVSEPKRVKTERKRNNSNGSSLDSEPPSPTPRNIRTGKIHPVGGVYGPLSKAMAGFRTIPSNPGKSLKSLFQHPIFVSSLNGSSTVWIDPAGGASLEPPNSESSILDNITIGPGPTGKIIHRPDLHKLPQTISPNPNYGGMVLMSDSRGTPTPPSSIIRGSSQLTKLLTSKPFFATNLNSQGAPRPSARANLTKFITSKRQLQTNRPKQANKLSTYMSPGGSALPPPTNLTSQDIMDLPIIFADDNQMLSNNTIQPSDISTPPITPTQIRSSTGKVMFLNKSFTSTLKRSSITKLSQGPIKIKKIFMTTPQEEAKRLAVNSADIPMDIEGALIANTITKRFKIDRSVDASYKTEVMSPSLVTNKIKQAIEDDSEYDINLTR